MRRVRLPLPRQVAALQLLLCATVVSCAPATSRAGTSGQRLDAAEQEAALFVGFPHVRGELLTFTYAGDVWVSAVDGTGSRRLTHGFGRVHNPRFSPDGRTIAFSSDRTGNFDVYTVSIDGDEPRRLTWHSANDVVQYWTADGTAILVTSDRGASPWQGAALTTRLFLVPLDGTVPRPLGPWQAHSGMISADGRRVLYSHLNFDYQGLTPTAMGAQHRGSGSSNVFLYDIQRAATRQLTDPDPARFRDAVHDGVPMWGADGMIYYLSERDGAFNVWRMTADGTRPRRLTSHGGLGARAASMSTDGTRIAYVADYRIHLLDVRRGTSRQVPLVLERPPVPPRTITAAGFADDFAVGPGGVIALEHRGEIFVVALAAPDRTERITYSAARDGRPRFSPDGRLLAYASDASGAEEVWIHERTSGSTRQLTQLGGEVGGSSIPPAVRSTCCWMATTSMPPSCPTTRSFSCGARAERLRCTARSLPEPVAAESMGSAAARPPGATS